MQEQNEEPVSLNRATELTPAVNTAIHDLFWHHDLDENQYEAVRVIREALVAAIKEVIRVVRPCPDRSTAIRKIREARMDCNSAITFRGKY